MDNDAAGLTDDEQNPESLGRRSEHLPALQNASPNIVSSPSGIKRISDVTVLHRGFVIHVFKLFAVCDIFRWLTHTQFSHTHVHARNVCACKHVLPLVQISASEFHHNSNGQAAWFRHSTIRSASTSEREKETESTWVI